MENLKELIIEWANQKGIIAQSNPQCQLLKTHEEIGELLKALQDDDLEEIKDAIGDIAVTLIIYAEMNHIHHDRLELTQTTKRDMEIQNLTLNILNEFAYLYAYPNVSKRIKGNHINDIFKYLHAVAGKHDLTLRKCLKSAYNIIKDRTGKMIDGTFVKDA